ncbi:MAG: phosphoenolpyruvate--protein phosphotransferase [Eubacteriales bacterium]|nr:phosphoenolpyruvate--protein phosphotransferase [Eubacteriales bacterium]
MRTFKGKPVSPGIAVGKVYQYKAFTCDVYETYVQPGGEQAALAAYRNAVREADAELGRIIGTFSPQDREQAKIFEAHRAILTDDEMDEEIRRAILEQQQSADFAVDRVCTEFAALLGAAPDANIAARAADVRDVRNRLLRILHGEKEHDLSRLPFPCVVVAHDLLPSDTATIDRNHVLAIVTEVGGATSHSAILARSFEIPAILGVPDATQALLDGGEVVVDALTGEVLAEPDAETLSRFRAQREAYLANRNETRQYLSLPAETKDGTAVEIGLNIGSGANWPENGGFSFVGLFRTEFLYMERDSLPTEDEQTAAYHKVLELAAGRLVTLRTLDIGGDKTLPALPLPKEENPFLGCRALRLSLNHRDLFLTQLRAALRSSVYGPIQIMFPMVGSLEDLRAGKAALEEAKAQLAAKGIPFDPDVPVGIMVEIPSIAILADEAARECDFASVGTNDLCQYLFAADRMNPLTAEYYQTFSPAMFRILNAVFGAFHRAGKPVSVCGEMAGDPEAAPVLLGLGLRKFSMNASAIPAVKRALRSVTLAEAEALARAVCAADTQSEVLALIRQHG